MMNRKRRDNVIEWPNREAEELRDDAEAFARYGKRLLSVTLDRARKAPNTEERDRWVRVARVIEASRMLAALLILMIITSFFGGFAIAALGDSMDITVRDADTPIGCACGLMQGLGS